MYTCTYIHVHLHAFTHRDTHLHILQGKEQKKGTHQIMNMEKLSLHAVNPDWEIQGCHLV